MFKTLTIILVVLAMPTTAWGFCGKGTACYNLICGWCSFCPWCPADTESDRTFIFSFFEMYQDTATTIVSIHIATAAPGGADVTLTTPLYDSSYQTDISINQDDVVMVDLPYALRATAGTVDNKGIQIDATADVSIHVNIRRWNWEGTFTVSPMAALGTTHYISTYGRYLAAFVVTATEDGTIVTLEFRSDMTGDFSFQGITYGPGTVLEVSLSKYETVSIVGSMPENDGLTGTKITANRPISVVSGNMYGFMISADYLIQQQFPVTSNMWGTTYHAILNPGSKYPTYFQVIASDDNTDIMVSGPRGTVSTLSTAGDNMTITHYPTLGEYNTIESTKPIAVTLFSAGREFSVEPVISGDAIMVTLLPESQFSTTCVFEAADYHSITTISIVIPASQSEGLLMDGANFITTKETIMTGSTMACLEASVDPGVHVLKHTDTNVGFAAYIIGHGLDSVSGAGYFCASSYN